MENISFLKYAVEVVLKASADSVYVEEEVYHLLWNDVSISQAKKQELSTHYRNGFEFIGDCLIFALSRSFIPKGKKSELIETKNFLVSDFLLDCHFPSVNRVFFGRDKELEDIHELLGRKKFVFLEGIGGIGKSELAKQYVKRYGKEYSHIVYLRYTGSLRQRFCN